MTFKEILEKDMSIFFNFHDFADVCIWNPRDGHKNETEIPYVFDGGIDASRSNAIYCTVFIPILENINVQRMDTIIINKEPWIVDAIEREDRYVLKVMLRRESTVTWGR